MSWSAQLSIPHPGVSWSRKKDKNKKKECVEVYRSQSKKDSTYIVCAWELPSSVGSHEHGGRWLLWKAPVSI